METSLSSVESTDYATYDRILRVISKFSKQATLAPSKDMEYVTYDNVINLTRSHSAELDGYVTTEVCCVFIYLFSCNPFVFRCYEAIKLNLHYPIMTSHR